MKNRSPFVFFLLISLCFLMSQDFSDGPYGSGYYDIAGPFTVNDLNASVLGDINDDEILNVQDIIILVNTIIGNIELSDEQIDSADVNNDANIDVLDIVIMVNMILYPQPSGWDFETEWNGMDSYIFVHYSSSVSGSAALWVSNTKAQFLENSPLNTHYFFISDRLTAPADIQVIKTAFDEIIATLPENLQTHWGNHLHYIPDRSSTLNNWLAESLAGEYSLGINRFQKISQIGYLGNPNGFSGTHISYLAHEAVYYNYEWDTFAGTSEDFLEITLFDSVVYSGGWSPTITSSIELPDEETLSQFSRMEVEAFMPCVDYDDDNCDDYDRTSRLRICDADDTDCYEMVRWITPFDRQPHWLTDITSFISMLQPGGEKLFKFNVSGWPNSIITVKLRLYEEVSEIQPKEFIYLWGGAQFNSNYNNNHDPVIFSIPENAQRIEFATYITGHGGGCDNGNCAEFCNSKHMFEVNGGVGSFEKSHPEASLLTDCMELESISEGVIPNQWGTWGYGRAGWCPGLDVEPFIVDITEYIMPGEENIMTYDACWVPWGTECSGDWPVPIDCGGGYQAEIIMSSYIIIFY